MTATTLDPSAFTPEEFRAALGQFTTGVTIITALDAEGRPIGLTANSFNSVSLAPPLILWSLAMKSGSLEGMRSAKAYAVNVLAADQRVLAERFASKGADRFEGVHWRAGLSGAPVIAGAVASFECTHRNLHEEGDHLIFVGHVQHCQRRVGATPLVYHGGRFITDLPL